MKTSSGSRGRLVDLVSRLGASPGFVTTEPGLAPKRLTSIFEDRLNQQAVHEFCYDFVGKDRSFSVYKQILCRLVQHI
ncbi:hypothetical protein RMSM_05041 [Rhodopirellula maiorica SM1]|uniref:Uncharacterized protein n=1 Tax=Rhodopirellula maiorica SM1 TaxID=1265738 RepID=M5RRM2_9BACT|nr:hypothetical protein RMSM_05041 [Rhodopirellula maiorica SM1]